jgi:hypothetical protein
VSEAQIHDLGHTAYQGVRTSPAGRMWAIARNVFGLAWRSRWGGKLPVLAAVGTTVTACLVMYVLRSTLADTVRARGVEIPRAEAIIFFAHEFYSLSAFVMSIMVVAAAVANDLRMGAFFFYFARPIRVRDYVTGKLGGLALLVGVPMFAGPMVLACMRLVYADDFSQALALSPVLGRAALLGVLGTAAFVLPAAGLGALMAKRQTAQAIYAVYFVLLGPAALGMSRWLRSPTISALYIHNDVSVVGRWLFGLPMQRSDPPLMAAAAFLVILCVGGLALVISRVRGAETAGLVSS